MALGGGLTLGRVVKGTQRTRFTEELKRCRNLSADWKCSTTIAPTRIRGDIVDLLADVCAVILVSRDVVKNGAPGIHVASVRKDGHREGQ